MATIQIFEDLRAWQQARELTNLVYDLSRQREFSRDFPLRDQIRGAGISTMSNVAEGFERRGDKEFSRFLSIAKGSAGEVRSQLYVAFDQSYITRPQFDTAYEKAVETSRTIAGLVNYVERSTSGSGKRRS